MPSPMITPVEGIPCPRCTAPALEHLVVPRRFDRNGMYLNQKNPPCNYFVGREVLWLIQNGFVTPVL